MCSMLSGAVSQLAIVHFGLTIDYAIPIAVFISFLGTEFFSSLLIGILKHGFNGHINHKP